MGAATGITGSPLFDFCVNHPIVTATIGGFSFAAVRLCQPPLPKGDGLFAYVCSRALPAAVAVVAVKVASCVLFRPEVRTVNATARDDSSSAPPPITEAHRGPGSDEVVGTVDPRSPSVAGHAPSAATTMASVDSMTHTAAAPGQQVVVSDRAPTPVAAVGEPLTRGNLGIGSQDGADGSATHTATEDPSMPQQRVPFQDIGEEPALDGANGAGDPVPLAMVAPQIQPHLGPTTEAHIHSMAHPAAAPSGQDETLSTGETLAQVAAADTSPTGGVVQTLRTLSHDGSSDGSYVVLDGRYQNPEER